MIEQLGELRTYAVEAGADIRLVQGAGGNFSVKSDDVMWIKASGTRLGQARREQIFLPMRLSETRAAVLQTADLTPFVLAEDSSATLRPSIETSLHALLPHRVVLHVHSTGAIAAGLGEDLEQSLEVLPKWFHATLVPYAKPGVQLARAVFEKVGDDVSDGPLALLLVNHGLVAAADDVSTARRIIDSVQQAFASRPAPVETATGTAPIGASDWTPLFGPGTLSSAETAVLRRGPLTPDQAVFMGPVPFASRADPDSESLAAIDDDGSVQIRRGIGADEIEIIRSVVDVVRLIRGAAAAPLDDLQVHELVNWEAEQWRRLLRR